MADEDGQVFETRAGVRHEAVRIQLDVAREEMPESDVVIAVKVRDESDRQVFEATLSLAAGWKD